MFERFWDWLNVSEQRFRDRALAPIVLRVVPRWVHPTYITLLRGVLVLAAVGMYLAALSLTYQVVTLVAAACTDTVDGVLARQRRQCTALGSFLDHWTDYGLGLWLGVVALLNQMVTLNMALWLIAPQLAVMVTDRMMPKPSQPHTPMAMAALAQPAAAPQGLGVTAGGSSEPQASSEWGQDPGLHPSALSRFQGTAVLIGFNCLLVSKVLARNRAWLCTGYVFVYLSVFFSLVQAGRGVVLAVRQRLAVGR